MNIYTLVIALSLISPLFSITKIQLTNNVPYDIGDLSYKNDLNFLIAGKHKQIIIIEVTGANPTSLAKDRLDIILTENSASSRLDNTAYLLSSNTNIFTVQHLILYSSTTYISFEIQPYNGLKSARVKATVTSNANFEYDIDSNTKEEILYFLPTNTYKFYIPTEYGKEVLMKLTGGIDSSSSVPSLEVYEYSDRNSIKELIKKEKKLYYQSYDNSYQASYFINDINCTYVAFKLYPKYETSNILVTTITRDRYNYDIWFYPNYPEEYLGDLYSDNIYQFNINAENTGIVDIQLISDDLNTNLYSYTFDIYEHADSYDIYGMTEKNIKPMNYSSVNSLLGMYNITSSKCKYIRVIFRSPHNMTSVTGKIHTIKLSNYGIGYFIKICKKEFYENLFNGEKYFFNFSAEYGKIYDIEFHKNDTYISKEEYLIVSECDSEYIVNTLFQSNIVLNYIPKQNSYINSYRISETPNVKMISLILKPKIIMEKVELLINERTPENYEYDLTNGTTLNIADVYAFNKYLFYFPIKYGDIVQISFTNINKKEDLIIYEYTDRSSKENLTYLIKQLKYSENTYIVNYEVQDSLCNYLAFELIPEYSNKDVNLIATIKSHIMEYDLYRDYGMGFDILFAPYIHKFYAPAAYQKKIRIEITSDDLTNYDSEKIIIYEYENRTSKVALVEKEVILSYSPWKYYYGYEYTITNSACKYFSFSKELYNDIESVGIHIRITPPDTYTLYLNSDIPEYIGAFINDDKYIYYISAKYGQKLNFEISKNDERYIDYQEIKFYEYTNQTSMHLLKTSNYYLSYFSSTNSYNYTYYINNTECNYIKIEMVIKRSFSSNYVKISVKNADEDNEESGIPDGGETNNNKGNNNGSNSFEASHIIIISVSSVIVMIVVVVIIIFIIRRNKRKNELNEIQNNNNEKPMIPLNPVN